MRDVDGRVDRCSSNLLTGYIGQTSYGPDIILGRNTIKQEAQVGNFLTAHVVPKRNGKLCQDFLHSTDNVEFGKLACILLPFNYNIVFILRVNYRVLKDSKVRIKISCNRKNTPIRPNPIST